MKKLDSYVLRELVTPFLIGTVAVVLMFQANMLIFQLKTFSLSSVPLLATLDIILYKTPDFMRMTLPVGTSLAAALAVSRLARESELTAMRIAGAAILRVCMPIAFFGVLVGIGNYLISERVMPNAELQARKIMQQVGLFGSLPEFKNNVTVNLPQYSANLGSVTKVDNNTLNLTDILLFERPDADVTQVIRADYGQYKDGMWTLSHTFVWNFKGDNLLTAKPGKDVIINDRITVSDFFSSPLDTEMSAAELLKGIKQRKALGIDATWSEVQYHIRFSIPAASVVFAFVAPVFAVLFARSGGFVGVLLSIFLVLFYYNCFIISTDILGRNGIVSPFVSAWLPNLVFLALGIIAVRRLE